MKTALSSLILSILLQLIGYSQQKSMRIFINNAVVDVMQYLMFEFSTVTERAKYSQTSDEIELDIRLDDGNSSLKEMDIILLTNLEDQDCYEQAVLMWDWTRNC